MIRYEPSYDGMNMDDGGEYVLCDDIVSLLSTVYAIGSYEDLFHTVGKLLVALEDDDETTD